MLIKTNQQDMFPDGEYSHFVGVAAADNGVYAMLHGDFGDPVRVMTLLRALGGLLPTLAEAVGMELSELVTVLTSFAPADLPRKVLRDSREEAEAKSAIEELAEEIGVGLPEE